MPDVQDRIILLRSRIEQGLWQLFSRNDEPEHLYSAARYVLEGGGKRIRPLLTLLAADIDGTASEDAVHAALAMEVFHNFTLVHDDIMDRSPLRRGRQTVHIKWDEPTAILCGDMLLGVAYEELARTQSQALPDMIGLMNSTVRTLCEGQTRDMVFESRDDVSVSEYLEMIDQKTGTLLETALVMGGYVSGASSERITLLKSLGWNLGRAFQLQDDVLDIIATDDRWGKPVGGDLVTAKKTYILVRAVEMEAASEISFFSDVVSRGRMDPSRLDEAGELLTEMGILDEIRGLISSHVDQAMTVCREFPTGYGRSVLEYFVDTLNQRSH